MAAHTRSSELVAALIGRRRRRWADARVGLFRYVAPCG